MAQIEDIEAGLKAELNAGQTDPSRLRALAALLDGVRGDIYAAEARAAVPPDASLADLAKDNAELKAAIADGDMDRMRAVSASMDGRLPLAMREEAVAAAARVSPAPTAAPAVHPARASAMPPFAESPTAAAGTPAAAPSAAPDDTARNAAAKGAADREAEAAKGAADREAERAAERVASLGRDEAARQDAGHAARRPPMTAGEEAERKRVVAEATQTNPPKRTP